MRCVTFSAALAMGVAIPVVALAQGSQPGSEQGQGMEAGGLAPPSSSTDQESQQTEQKLEDADTKDSGRGLEWFYLNAEVGFEHLGLQTFKTNDRLVDASVVSTTQTGALVGAGLGLRLVFITIGPRFRVGMFKDYQVWTLDAEVGLRIPLGSVEPYLTLSGGYASLGALNANNLGPASGDVSITGYDIRAGGGLDIYVTPVFSIGASLTGELLGLTRPGVDPSKLGGSAMGSAAQIYGASGSSLGFGLTGTAVLGLHF